MLKKLVFALCLLQGLVYAGGPMDWTYLYQKVYINDIFLEAKVKKIEKTYYHKGKKVSLEKLKKIYADYLTPKDDELIDGGVESEGDDFETPNSEGIQLTFKSHATLEIKSVLMAPKGFEGHKEIKVIWEDLYDSMCPHDESLLKEGDRTVLYKYSKGKKSKWRAIRSDFAESLKELAKWAAKEKARFAEAREAQRADDEDEELSEDYDWDGEFEE